MGKISLFVTENDPSYIVQYLLDLKAKQNGVVMSAELDDLFEGYPSLLSVAKLAEVLGVTQKTAYDYLQSADLPSYRIGNRWLILRDEVKNHINTRARYSINAESGAQ